MLSRLYEQYRRLLTALATLHITEILKIESLSQSVNRDV